MKNSTDSPSKECDWLIKDLPNAKPSLENESENQQRLKQMPKDNTNSTSTCTVARKERVTTTTSADNSPKRKKLPPVAKSDMYKTKLCHNYMENGRCNYGKVCQFAHGVKELRKYSLYVCWINSCVASSHHMQWLADSNKHQKREMDSSQLFCWRGWPPWQRRRTCH